MKNYFGNIFGKMSRNILEKQFRPDCAEIDIMMYRKHMADINFIASEGNIFFISWK